MADFCLKIRLWAFLAGALFLPKRGFGSGGLFFPPQPCSFILPGLPWKFELNQTMSIFLGWWVPPFCLKIRFWLGVVNLFIPNLVHLFGLAYPENFSSIEVGWIFGWFGGVPHFCLKIGFWLRGGIIFITNYDHLFELAYPENLSSIRLSWISWRFGGGESPYFCLKIGFWLMGG